MRLDFPILAAVLLIAGQTAARADDVVVLQEGKKFSEAEVSVKPGDTVTFTNKDPATQNVYSDTSGMAFDLKQQKAGESTTIAFQTVGEAVVHCATHPCSLKQ